MGNGALSFNIQGQGISADPVITDVMALGPRTAIVINESKLAAALLPHVPRLVYRMSDTSGIRDDDGAYSKHEARPFVGALHALAPAGCWLYMGNEQGDAEWPRQVAWNQAGIAECARFGRRPLILNNFTHHPAGGRRDWRVLKPAVVDAEQAGGGVGVHIYIDRTVAATPDAYRVIADIREVCSATVPIVVSEYAIAIGIDPNRGYLGEVGSDAYADELQRGVAQYGDANVDWCVYLYGIWFGRSQSFNIQHDATLKGRMSAFNAKGRPMGGTTADTFDYGAQIDGAAISSSGVRLRAQPGTTADILTSLPDGALVTTWANTRDGDGLKWRRVRYLKDGAAPGVVGFAAAQYVTLPAPVPVPTPVPTPPPALYVPLSADECNQLAGFHTQIADIYRAAAKRGV